MVQDVNIGDDDWRFTAFYGELLELKGREVGTL
jgi:hypothetical protein